MIAKMSKGQGVRGLLSYLLAEQDNEGRARDEHRVIGGTIMGDSVGELSRQFAQWRALKPDLKNIVVHESLRLPEGESLSARQWREIGDRWAQAMGFDAYSVVMHGPDHCHIAALRVTADGRTVSDSQDWKRSEQIVREIEVEYGLQQVAPSHLLDPARRATHKKAPTREQIGMHERTGKVAPSVVIAAAIDELTRRPVTASAFVEALEKRGIGVRANIASTGKMSGFCYELDGVSVTAKALGRGYTFGNLQGRGLSYEQSRDFERCRATNVSAEIRADADAERSAHADRDEHPSAATADRAERGGFGAAGSVDADAAWAVVKDVAELGQDHRTVIERESGLRQADQRNEGVVREAAERLGRRDGQNSEAAISIEALDIRDSSDAVRVIAAHSGVGLSIVQSAVEQTLAALPDEAYEIGMLRRDTGEIRKREWNAEQIVKAIPYLRHENALGREILFRPTDTRYVMLDDVKAEAVERMKVDGLAPALVVETSKENLQAWLKLPRSVTDTERSVIGKRLAQHYDADTAATDWRRFGKLSGFTNRKPEREFERAGRILAPFVRLVEAAGVVAQRGADLITWAQKMVASQVQAVRVQTIKAAQPVAAAVTAFDQARAAVVAAQPGRKDESQIDFMTAQRLLVAGHDPEAIEAALTAAATRKGRHAADYAARTVTAAAASDWVQDQLKRQEHEPGE